MSCKGVCTNIDVQDTYTGYQLLISVCAWQILIALNIIIYLEINALKSQLFNKNYPIFRFFFLVSKTHFYFQSNCFNDVIFDYSIKGVNHMV